MPKFDIDDYFDKTKTQNTYALNIRNQRYTKYLSD